MLEKFESILVVYLTFFQTQQAVFQKQNKLQIFICSLFIFN